MKKVKTFIFVHDQSIVLDFKKHNKFKQLDDVKYVFVGNRDSSMIESDDDVIICNKLKNNLENYPKLTSYTGWYAIWKNDLYDSSDYLNLLEYDVNLTDNFDKIVKENLNFDVIGYKPFNVHHNNFAKHKPWVEDLIKSIHKNYNINVHEFINSLPFNEECSVTSNHTFSKKSFEDYMKWVNPLIDDIKHSELSGHQVERSISLFYLINKLNHKVIDNILTHFNFDSHRTQNISQDKFKNEYNKLLK
jgi:NAD-dependent DNA ligase